MPSIQEKIDQYKNTDSIRKEWDIQTEKWYFSIVDSVGIAAKTSDPRNYWKVLKNRLKKSQNKLVTECNQLKIKSRDGKFYLTDVADAETTLKIVEMIDPKSVPYFCHFFDNLTETLSNNFPISANIEEEKVDEVLEENLSYPQLKNKTAEKNNSDENFELLLDAYYKKNLIVIKAFTAGVGIHQLNIRLTSTSITISGSRHSASPAVAGATQEENIRELYWGNFSRTLEFPHEVDPRRVESHEEGGMLTIKIPLVEKPTPKKIIKMRTI